MIYPFEPYPAYKDSGVEWLGDVPEHWEVRRLKHSATLIIGQSPPSDDCSDVPIGPPFLQGCAEFGTLHPKPIQFCRTLSKISPPGAILMSVRAPVGRLNIANQEYGIGRGLCAILPNNEVLHAGLAQYQLEVLGRGLNMVATGSTYEAVSVGDVGNHPSILPPLPEQAAIVRYLDHADRRIRRCIRAKQKLIKLLEEQKQAVIHRAVTGRIDVLTGQPYPAYKSSGVEWLGDVPEHWETLPLCAIGTPKSITGQQHRELLSVYLGRGVIRFFEAEEKRTNVTSEDLSKYQAVDPGDFVLNNQQAWRGSVGVSNHSGIVSPAYIVLSLNPKLHPDFANLLFQDRVMVTQSRISHMDHKFCRTECRFLV